jgi:uncharacterized membrane protein YccC
MIPEWLTKAAIAAFVIVSLALGTAIFAARAADKFSALIETVRKQERDSRDAFWTAQIEKSNALAAQAEVTQAKEALRLNSEAANTIADLRAQLSTLKAQNAKLPNGSAIGLDRARVRLLPD